MNNIKKAAIILMSLFFIFNLTACQKPEPIVLEARDNIQLDAWLSIDLQDNKRFNKIKAVEIFYEDDSVDVLYESLDNSNFKVSSKANFRPDSEYKLIVTYNNNQQYIMEFTTISRKEQILIYVEESFFIMPDSGEWDESEAQKMKNRILKISPKILLSMLRAGVKMKLTNAPITEEPELQYLKGVVPRGWEYTGMTWDDVPGAGGYDLPIARIGYSDPKPENNHDTINLELHELAHTVDNYISGSVDDPISFSDEFVEIWREEVYDILPYDYFINYVEEYFAEVFAMYYLNEESKSELKENAIKTYNFIDDLDRFTNLENLE